MRPPPPLNKTTLYSDNSPSPLGQVTLIASLRNGRGVQPSLPLRIYGSYALVCITAGQGTYADASGIAQNVEAGDAIFVFPDLPHTYGPCLGETWDEFFIVFAGPAFDAWRQMGLLTLSRPVVRLSEPEGYVDCLRSLVLPPGELGEAARAGQVCRLLAVLTEVALAADIPPAPASGDMWLARACALLSEDLGGTRTLYQLAQPLGLPYETFRKKFRQSLGQSPAQFRARKRMEAAADLMQYTSLTNVQIAEYLGFGDEFHFSKRFKQIKGETPTAFRQRTRG